MPFNFYSLFSRWFSCGMNKIPPVVSCIWILGHTEKTIFERIKGIKRCGGLFFPIIFYGVGEVLLDKTCYLGWTLRFQKPIPNPISFLFCGLGYSFQLFFHNTALLTTVLLTMITLYKAYETGSKSMITCFTLQELP